jgi:DNA-binding response OmpR family regulator
LLDDDEAMRESLKRVSGIHRLNVMAACGGAEAVQLIGQFEPVLLSPT